MILLTAGFVYHNTGLPLSKGWATILIGSSVAAFEYRLTDHISHSASVAMLFEVVIEMYTASSDSVVMHVHIYVDTFSTDGSNFK